MRERRNAARYPVWLPCSIRGGDADEGVAATVVDISVSGASVETAASFDEGPAQLQLKLAGDRHDMPMEVVDVERNWYGVTVHARFGELEAQQAALLAAIIDELDRQQRTQLRRLSSRWSG